MLLDFSRRPLLPSEPRVLTGTGAHELTERHLQPVLAGLEALFLTLRARLDPLLQAARPIRLGKPYPLGQCLEISLAVEKHLKQVDPTTLDSLPAAGHAALMAFLRAGGTMRRIWGDLRGRYFQNAFLVGTLYIDVSNDTVVATKPKVEILPFDQSGLTPIADYRHYGRIATAYWGSRVLPNHIAPELAPYCPVMTVSPTGVVKFQSLTRYMQALTTTQGFAPSQAVLAEAPMPQEWFDQLRTALAATPIRLAANPEAGRQQALRLCRDYRTRRWHRHPAMGQRLQAQAEQANHHLVQVRAISPAPAEALPVS